MLTWKQILNDYTDPAKRVGIKSVLDLKYLRKNQSLLLIKGTREFFKEPWVINSITANPGAFIVDGDYRCSSIELEQIYGVQYSNKLFRNTRNSSTSLNIPSQHYSTLFYIDDGLPPLLPQILTGFNYDCIVIVTDGLYNFKDLLDFMQDNSINGFYYFGHYTALRDNYFAKNKYTYYNQQNILRLAFGKLK